MKLEQQVCSFDLAKRLKELGVKQESQFYWTEDEDLGLGLVPYVSDTRESISAFTVAELGEMLPIMVRGKVVKFHKLGVVDQWIVEYTPVTYDNEKYHTEGPTEADARAKMLIHLIEQGLVNPNGAERR